VNFYGAVGGVAQGPTSHCSQNVGWFNFNMSSHNRVWMYDWYDCAAGGRKTNMLSDPRPAGGAKQQTACQVARVLWPIPTYDASQLNLPLRSIHSYNF